MVTAPVPAITYAALSGWVAAKAPGNMPSEGTGSYGLAMDPGAAQFARLEHFASVVGGDAAAVRLDDAALAMAAVLRARPTEAARDVLDELATACWRSGGACRSCWPR